MFGKIIQRFSERKNGLSVMSKILYQYKSGKLTMYKNTELCIKMQNIFFLILRKKTKKKNFRKNCKVKKLYNMDNSVENVDNSI